MFTAISVQNGPTVEARKQFGDCWGRTLDSIEVGTCVESGFYARCRAVLTPIGSSFSSFTPTLETITCLDYVDLLRPQSELDASDRTWASTQGVKKRDGGKFMYKVRNASLWKSFIQQSIRHTVLHNQAQIYLEPSNFPDQEAHG